MSDLNEDEQENQMKTTELGSALQDEYRNPDAYIDQSANFIRGVLRLAGWWATATITATVGVALVAFLVMDLSATSLPEAQQLLRLTVACVGTLAALVGLLSRVGGFRNMFSVRASAKVQRFEALRTQFGCANRITEHLLVSHRLITEDDVERRRKDVLSQSSNGQASAKHEAQA